MFAFRTSQAVLVCGFLCFLARATHLPSQARLGPAYDASPQCPQVESLFPKKHHELDVALGARYSSDAFKETLVKSLSSLVQIPYVARTITTLGQIANVLLAPNLTMTCNPSAKILGGIFLESCIPNWNSSFLACMSLEDSMNTAPDLICTSATSRFV